MRGRTAYLEDRTGLTIFLSLELGLGLGLGLGVGVDQVLGSTSGAQFQRQGRSSRRDLPDCFQKSSILSGFEQRSDPLKHSVLPRVSGRYGHQGRPRLRSSSTGKRHIHCTTVCPFPLRAMRERAAGLVDRIEI